MTDGSGVARTAVEHVVALVLENRSFDHILGALGRSGDLPLDGGTASMTNPDLNGQAVGISPAPFALGPDLPHDLQSVTTSLMDGNSGFVRADQLQHRDQPADPARVMSFFEVDTLPVSHPLAREYASSDAWFCSVPSGTWPNRLFLVAASSGGRVTNTAPWALFALPTVFDRLGPSDWAVYNDQLPNVTLIRSLAIEWLRDRHQGGHFRSLDQFESDAATGALPAFSYIEPVYLGGAADDGHPPRDILLSERLIARVYLALRRSPNWQKSLLLILYDEHGGLFDHVTPPSDVPGTGTGEFGFDFSRLGVRVPCLIVSPYAARGHVWRPGSGFADHTSLIASLLRRRGLAPLTPRDATAHEVWGALTEDTPRDDDGATLTAIDLWFSEEAVAVPAWGGPLDPSVLEGRTGREVAAVIAALRPAPEAQLVPQPAAAVAEAAEAAVGQATGSEPAEVGSPDQPFEQALVDLARRLRDMPA